MALSSESFYVEIFSYVNLRSKFYFNTIFGFESMTAFYYKGISPEIQGKGTSQCVQLGSTRSQKVPRTEQALWGNQKEERLPSPNQVNV